MGQRFSRIFLGSLAIILAALFIGIVIYAASIFLMVFAGILLSVFLSTIADYLNEHTFLSRGVGFFLLCC